MQGMQRIVFLRPSQAEEWVQGLQGPEYLQPQQAKISLQGVRGFVHLQSQQTEKYVQGVRGLGYLQPRQAEISLQGLLGLSFLPSRPAKVWLPRVRERGILILFSRQGVECIGEKGRREESWKTRCCCPLIQPSTYKQIHLNLKSIVEHDL